MLVLAVVAFGAAVACHDMPEPEPQEQVPDDPQEPGEENQNGENNGEGNGDNNGEGNGEENGNNEQPGNTETPPAEDDGFPKQLEGLPTVACYIMPCCRTNNNGTMFMLNDRWRTSHNYGDIKQTRGILTNIKNAGINVIGIDFTNPSQWDGFGESAAHNGDGGEFWYMFKPMLDNITLVCAELDMEYFLFIGNTQAWGMEYWNNIAGKILDNWAKDPHYRKYGYGDDRPLLVAFIPGTKFAAQLKSTPENKKNNLMQFRIGTCQVNEPIAFTATDGWGYRNYSESYDHKVRFACPNGGVPPQDWFRVGADTWKKRVRWALEATEYAVIGSYDDTCDAIFWGIADVVGSHTECHKNSTTVNDPFIYYDIVRKAVTGLDPLPRPEI